MSNSTQKVKHRPAKRTAGKKNIRIKGYLRETVTSKVGLNTFIAPIHVYKFDTTGNLVATYHSAYAAAIANRMAHCQLSNAAYSKKPFRNSFYRYTDKFDMADLAYINTSRPIQIVASRRGSKAKPIYSYDATGKFVRSFRTSSDAKAFLEVNDISHISKAINGVRAIAFGYMWSDRFHSNLITYKKQQFNIVAKNSKGEKLWSAESYEDAAAKLDVPISEINRVVDTGIRFQRKYKLVKEYTHKF